MPNQMRGGIPFLFDGWYVTKITSYVDFGRDYQITSPHAGAGVGHIWGRLLGAGRWKWRLLACISAKVCIFADF